MKKRNILFLTVNFPPNPSVGTKRVAKILKYVDQSKFNFCVLTLKEEYYNTELGKLMGNQSKIPAQVKVFRTKKSDFTYLFTIGKQKIKALFSKSQKAKKNQKISKARKQSDPVRSQKLDWKKVWANKLRSFFFTFFEFPDKYNGWFPYAIAEGIRIIRKEKIDVILTTAPPHSVFITALILKKLTHKKLILDFRDPWAISRWDKGNIFHYWMECLVERLCVQSADLLFFVTPKMRDEYLKIYHKENPAKFKLFFNGFDPDDFKNVKQASKKVSNEQPFRFVHLGTLYKRRNPEPLLKAIKNLHEKKVISAKNVQFEFIGGIDTEMKFILQKTRELALEDYVKFRPPVSFEKSIETMLIADCLLLIQPDTDLQIPAKLFEYIYTQKPILAIAEENSATHQILSEGNLGILAPSKNIPAIEQGILDILHQNFTFQPRPEYIAQFNYQKYAKKFEGLLYAV